MCSTFVVGYLVFRQLLIVASNGKPLSGDPDDSAGKAEASDDWDSKKTQNQP